MAQEAGTASLLRFGVFELDLRTGELRKSGKRVRLAPQPFRLLALLAGRPGQLVTREEIQRELWGDGTVVDYEQGLRFAIKKARAALGDHPNSPKYIETLPRRGYRFIAPVEAGVPSAGPSVPSAADGSAQRAPSVPWWRRFWLAGAGLAAMAAVLFTFNVGSLRSRVFEKPSAHIHSIAVLPLQDLAQGPDREYFADGMTDQLITDLSRISALRVIARTSSMAYRGSKKPLRQIARELNVDAVVEGSVEQAGGRIRINIRLVDGTTARNLWAQSYERDSKNVLSLQSDVAKAIAKKIRAQVTPQERQRLRAARPVNPAAHDAYLRGSYLIDQRNDAEARRSTQYFRQAIDIDPGYSAAYAGLAMSLVSQSFFGIDSPRVLMPEAGAAARHALQLDPDSGEAYTALGTIEFNYDWDWKAARRDLQRGVQLDPGNSLAEILYTFYLADVGNLQQALAGARKAVKLDPVSFFANRNLAMMLYFNRRYDAALAQLQRTRELHDEPGEIDNWVCWVYEKKHMQDKAVQIDLRLVTKMGAQPAELQLFRSAYARGGWRGYWRARIQRMLHDGKKKPDPYSLAIKYARIGDKDDAFRWLNRTIDQHSIWAAILAVDPLMDAVRSDPRFHALLRRINLPQESVQAMR